MYHLNVVQLGSFTFEMSYRKYFSDDRQLSIGYQNHLSEYYALIRVLYLATIEINQIQGASKLTFIQI